MEKLEWVGIEIESDEQADLLIESIIDNQSIKRVSLESSFVGRADANGCRALALLMMSGKSFETLDFGYNELSVIDDVTAALGSNPCLEKLNMVENELNDRDAGLIAQVLTKNTNLKELYLTQNNITSAGIESIQAVIYDPSSLNAMESCNHTCYIDCVTGNDFDMMPQQRRNRKVYKLLSTRHNEGSNARHLNTELGEESCTIKLVPRVLERIGLISDGRPTGAPMPLSIYFELIRSWQVPEYFSAIAGD